MIPAASSDVLRDGIPGARLEVIRGAGHLFREAPAETMGVLEGFLHH